MKKTILFALLIIGVSLLPLSAQKKHKFLIGVETGNNFLEGKLKDSWFIRQDAGKYSNQMSFNRNVSGAISHSFFGIKPELSLLNDRLSLLSGLRIHELSTELGNYFNNTQSYFFLRYEQDDSNVKFARIRSAIETTHYLSIPLEVKYVFLQSSWLGVYVKAGTEGGVKVHNEREMNFLDKKMNVHKNEIWNKLSEKPNSFYASIYGSLGIRAHLTPRIDLNLELGLPHTLTSNNHSMLNRTNNTRSSIRMSIQIPLDRRDTFYTLFK